jgi:outer membrane protein TolC
MSGSVAFALLVLAAPFTPGDTLRLAELHSAAVQHDPRARQILLQADAHELRMRTLRSERLPELRIQGEGSTQSEVVRLPIGMPNVEIPEPPRTRFQASVTADQLLYDGGALRTREAVDRARSAETVAQVEEALHPLRMEVNEAFFGALLLQVEESEVRLLIEDLDGRLGQVRAQVRAGAALPGDTPQFSDGSQHHLLQQNESNRLLRCIAYVATCTITLKNVQKTCFDNILCPFISQISRLNFA